MHASKDLRRVRCRQCCKCKHYESIIWGSIWRIRITCATQATSVFKMKSDLCMHVQSIHGISVCETVCDVYGKTYYNSFAFKKRLNQFHSDHRFFCHICGGSSRLRNRYIERHCKLQSGERYKPSVRPSYHTSWRNTCDMWSATNYWGAKARASVSKQHMRHEQSFTQKPRSCIGRNIVDRYFCFLW